MLKNRQTKRTIILWILSISIVLILSLIIFTILQKQNPKILFNVHINNIDVSKMTIKEAKEKLYLELTCQKSLNLTYKDFETTLLPSDIDFSFDVENSIKEAYLLGRTSNIFVNCFHLISSIFHSQNINAKYNYNEEKLANVLNNINIELPGLKIEPNYYIDNNSLVICKGHNGIILCQTDIKELILSTFSNSNNSSINTIKLDIPVKFAYCNNIDIDKIYKEIYSEPQNAYITKDPICFNMNVDGVDFAIPLEEVKKILEEDKKQYTIPLKITKANITIEDLDKEIFVDTISAYTSRYNISNVNRSNNVEIATRKLNNVIILPGETFSYNKIVGERTISAGYKEATIYTSNGVQHGIGGGVCQVSSTLYNAVLQADLDIIERKNHRYSVSYVPLGCDATVSYGSIDFKFKNTKKYPIKLQAFAKNGIVSISLIGLNENASYDISFVTKKICTIPFETKYIHDNTLSSGSKVIIQKGSYGYKINNYKIIKENGSLISETLISSDTYSPLTQIIRIGK